MKQTLESQSPARTLVANSRFVRLGSFETFVSGHDMSKDLSLDFVVEIPPITPSRPGLRPQRRGYPSPWIRRRLNLREPSRQGRTNADEGPARHFLRAEYVLRARSEFPLFDESQSTREGELIAVGYPEDAFVQRASFSSYSMFGQKTISGLKLVFIYKENAKYEVMWDDLPSDLPPRPELARSGKMTADLTFINLMPTPLAPEEEKSPHTLQFVFGTVSAVQWALRLAFESLSYLGPLREQPARRYLYEEEVIEIGTKGENVPFILAAQRTQRVLPYHMPSSRTGEWLQHSDKALVPAVESWLSFMGISPTISSGMHEGLGYLDFQASMKSDTKVSIADVGFGVSQILPIIVEGLRLGTGETLILEQPEIHLHPAMQLKLADFLIGMALSGRRFIIETHSDHIVNRLVRRMVEDSELSLGKKVKLIFIEPGSTGSCLREVQVHEDRGIVDWPFGFFDQAADEYRATIEAGIEKRRGRTGGGS